MLCFFISLIIYLKNMIEAGFLFFFLFLLKKFLKISIFFPYYD
jgi:hypothetical protein